jgi:hypothetical protein
MVEGTKVLPYGHKEVYPEIDGLTEAYEWSRKTPRRLSLSNEAARRFDELRVMFLQKMMDMPSHLTCYVQRTPEQILRVAAVLAASERKTTISRKAIEAAWAFVQYSMRSVERLVREDTRMSGKVIKSLPELIREVLARHGGEATSSLLLRSLGPRADASSLKHKVETMDDVTSIRGETASGRGRPPVIYRLVTAADTVAKEEPKKFPVSAPVVVHEPAPKEGPELALSSSWL